MEDQVQHLLALIFAIVLEYWYISIPNRIGYGACIESNVDENCVLYQILKQYWINIIVFDK